MARSRAKADHQRTRRLRFVPDSSLTSSLAKPRHFAKEILVLGRELVALFGVLAVGKRGFRFAAPVHLDDVTAKPLDQVLGQLGTNRRPRIGLPDHAARSPNLASISESSERNASSLPLCGVAVTSIRWRSSDSQMSAISSNRAWRACPTFPASVQVWASSTMTSSGHSRRKSSRRRGDLMKSVETMMKRIPLIDGFAQSASHVPAVARSS